ncbi:MAG: hypothetical protein HKP09_07430 [Enterobacterales bacterium]|nr:hypothetical protein [Enterobacterales bacterium]
MKSTKTKIILLSPIVLFGLFYLVGVFMVATDDRTVEPRANSNVTAKDIAIFGASGTAGDGILKAALDSSEIATIYVITRRVTPRMEQGVNAGKIKLIKHMDYLDYSEIINQLANVDTTFWAIGITSIGTDEAIYRKIHTDFPMKFLQAWKGVNSDNELSFHFISSSDISEDSTTMWIREKIRAEKSLFSFAEEQQLKVIAYRPDYIGQTNEEAHIGQNILYWFFAPVGAAVKATEIGQAMIEVSGRDNEFKNGDKLVTRKIIRYSDAYESKSN